MPCLSVGPPRGVRLEYIQKEKNTLTSVRNVEAPMELWVPRHMQTESMPTGQDPIAPRDPFCPQSSKKNRSRQTIDLFPSPKYFV